MRLRSALFFGLTYCMVAGSCAQAATVSNDMAQIAVTAWVAGDGYAVVRDVQEIPAANMAQADFDISNMTWNAPQNNAVTAYAFGPGGGQHVYSGPMKALFVHYTDGSWVLVKVMGPMGSYDNLHFVAQ